MLPIIIVHALFTGYTFAYIFSIYYAIDAPFKTVRSSVISLVLNLFTHFTLLITALDQQEISRIEIPLFTGILLITGFFGHLDALKRYQKP